MYVEEIILEGFKSYATRTVISGWDPEFNAITGLNGTGKSNILDAICFVRATSLQDLVYKRGQAGITKASVTVVFNNSNSAQSPVGYADCPQVTVTRQIVLNGKNKYLINGHNAQQKAVENLFQSVQLNVNNPHFLIMQGQITRVLNMKPEEILAMIEESAGTRMFEDRKNKAISTLDKKEQKVQEIAALLNDTIEPKLNALRSERSEFLEYKRTEADLERLQRLVKSFRYMKNMQALEKGEQKMKDCKESLTNVSSDVKEKTLEAEKVADDIFNVTKKRERESQASHKVKELEMACREISSTMVRIQTDINFKKEALEAEDRSIAEISSKIDDENAKIERLTAALSGINSKYSEADATRTKLQCDLARDEELLRSLETGLSVTDTSSETGYAKLLKESKDRQSQAQTALKQAQMRAKALKSEISGMEGKVKSATKDSEMVVKKIDALKLQISTLETEPLGEEPSSNIGSLIKERTELEANLSLIQEELDSLRSAVTSVEFRYSISDANFDHGKVKGVVAELVHLDESRKDYSTALEVSAGGRLYNVVVEDEKTAAILLDKGKLTRRVTIIPLNKIQSRSIPSEKLALADQVTKGQAKVGLSLIGYEKDVSEAMQYVFGGTFICDNKESAALMAFDRRFGHRAVTVDGDVYEPSGTLSGGSSPSSGNIIAKLNRFRQLTTNGAEMQARLDVVKKEISVLEGRRRGHIESERSLKAKQQELATLTRQFELNSSGQTLERYKAAKAELEDVEGEIQKQTTVAEQAEKDCALYETEISELSNDREGKLASLTTQHTGLRVKLDTEQRHLRQYDNELKALDAKKSELEEQIESLGLERKKLEDSMILLEKEVKRLSDFLQNLISGNPWINDSKSGGMFDYSQYNMSEVEGRVSKLEGQKETLRKTINFNVMDMIDRVESKDHSLKQMLSTVKNDRGKIEGTITKLNDYMLEALHKTWTKVNSDFGQIFGELLPASSAKLDPLEGRPITDGLEIKVCLGGVWKQSLSELSGGQRSLVALSLILSLLQFKPAPMYILDEVDAALDLSHTENIGRLLKSRFRGSQFIVVSLKEGMFANANVLFRTRFRDGVSGVDRSTNIAQVEQKKTAKKTTLKLRSAQTTTA
ncbi:Smc2 sister chromatid cohesion [Paramicrosporidium saccamoebae]|uniref:Smc2 sister chromatid cohesion n=1 Tax=Paramicrosporidium saccamoebae TaxID=1246581 RepID=A0A2H9TJS9_9FUNG|nr:Smc2 sister chromatid cohesion [Paramicrosporidium saccamoebae]